MPDAFTAAQFEDRVGDTFRVIDPDGPVLELKLATVSAFEDPARPAELPPPFNVVFHGPLQPILPQRIYRLDNDSTGSLDLFIVPIGPEEGAMRYEAAFG